MKLHRLGSFLNTLGESPLWDHRRSKLFWVDSLNCEIWHHDLSDGSFGTQQVPEPVGALGLRANGQLIASLKSGLHAFDPETGATEFLVDPEPDRPDNRLNDGRVGPDGCFWIGSHCDARRLPTAGLYKIGTDHSVTQIDDGLTIANGVAFAPDGSRLYYADTPANELYVRDRNPETGVLGAREVFHDFSNVPGRPDGAAVDTDGNYWSAFVRGGAIGCFSPGGNLLRKIEVPTTYPTMCAFGGKNLDTLYVTSTNHLIAHENLPEDPHAGAVFVIEGLGATGLKSHEFAG
ncbi:SMP-30/gluconolactonase/LRE family protein [Ruegeria jejuensis]|uniref:SMP-30/gluconolactonase/LRE family protein n=1 Tax=Ruegeria jejuensis TaxID=3233338 RepID=UPI00355C6F0D